MKFKLAYAAIVAFVTVACFAQTVQSLIGTVASIDPQSGELAFKPDNGERLTTKISSDTVLQRVAPGERDLKKAEPMQASEIAPGDRVLVSIDPGTNTVRRIVVMSAADIGKRNQADRQDWIERGISGVVTAKKSDELTVAARSAGSEKTVLVTLVSATVYKRYAPDSVRFADAKSSKPEEIQIGDQLRARGQKSADGSKLVAEEVVFGTFLTKAGSVASVDAAAKEIHLTELGTGKPLVVRLTADTTIKAMPDFPGGAPPFPGQGARGQPPVAAQGAAPFGAPGGRGGVGFTPPDPAEMIDRMPPGTIDAVKPGQSIVVLSTKGANTDELTAITLVANAQMLIQMATMRSGGAQRPQNNAAPSLSPGVMGGGFDLSGMGLSGIGP